MAYVDKINAGGELRDIHDTAGRQMIAPIELTSTATAAHAKGEYFIYNDTLYEATSAIAVGGTITPNTNCTAVPDGVSNEFGGEISQLKSALSSLQNTADKLDAEKADKNEVASLSVETDRQGTAIDGLKDGLSEETEAREADVERLDAEGARLVDAITMQENRLSGVAAEIDMVSNRLAHAEDQITTKADITDLAAAQVELSTKAEAKKTHDSIDNKPDANYLADMTVDLDAVVRESGDTARSMVNIQATIQDIQSAVGAKVAKPTVSPNGTSGQFLQTYGDGTTIWAVPDVASDEQVGNAVSAWLDAHPEVTTTIEDGAVSMEKLSPDVQSAIENSSDVQELEIIAAASSQLSERIEMDDNDIIMHLNNYNAHLDRLIEFSSFFSVTNGMGFLFFTDPHTMSGYYNATPYTMLCDMRYIRTVFENTPAAYVLCGGDWLNVNYTQGEALMLGGRVANLLKTEVSPECYTVPGNHEYNRDGTNPSSTYLTYQQLANAWFGRDVGYYVIEREKCDCYMLDADYSVNSMNSYQQTELHWFAEKLLTNTKPHLFAVGHILTAPEGGSFGGAVCSVADAFNKRESITVNGRTYDFASASGTFHFCLAGHYHSDGSDTVSNIPVILTRDFATSKAIDCCYADFDSAKLRIVRIGKGSSRNFNIVPNNQ